MLAATVQPAARIVTDNYLMLQNFRYVGPFFQPNIVDNFLIFP